MSSGQDQESCARDQARQLGGVLRPHDVPISSDDQGWYADRPHRVVRHVTETPHPPRVLVVHPPERLFIRVHPKERVLELWAQEGRIRAAFVFQVRGGRIAEIHIIMEPTHIGEMDVETVGD